MEHQNNSFDFLRFSAATLVIWGHSYELNAMPSVPTVFASTVNSMGVVIFFIISGFLVTESLRRSDSFIDFFWKRALRIFPGLIVCTLLTALVLGPLVSALPTAEYFANPLVADFLKNAVLNVHYFLPGVFQQNHIIAVNGSLWSLPVEALCYIVLGTLGYVIVRKGCRLCSLVLAVMSVAAAIFFSTYGGPPIIFYQMSLSHIFLVAPYFFVASSMNMIFARQHFRLDVALGCVAALFLVVAAKNPTLLTLTQPVLLSYVALTIGMMPLPVIRSWSRLEQNLIIPAHILLRRSSWRTRLV
ncbi:acyltransferase [Mesorhizobium sp. PAMC28654]|uniref:acyltransferase family protein n=1 Tax=Mesorhizobium sp. PAMC28654 TaxID=2880934 RepID=UPI001D0A284D|nr:acyltransferase [Mesorhizobium sp. PAMC28654]UDL91623.1 acyltransferase [Mesorhizobium sp. PAMC28654]